MQFQHTELPTAAGPIMDGHSASQRVKPELIADKKASSILSPGNTKLIAVLLGAPTLLVGGEVMMWSYRELVGKHSESRGLSPSGWPCCTNT